MQEINLTPVGYVKNLIENKDDMLAPGIKSTLVIYDNYKPALQCLSENSHVIVCCYFHQANKETLKVFPKKFKVVSPIEKGIFATRSPDRPNPITITVTRLLEVTDNEVMVECLDAINGTPVLDIKPYSIGSDCVFNTQSINKKIDFSRVDNEQLYEYLKFGVLNYIYNADDTLELTLRSLIKIIRSINKIPDRDIVDYIETNYSKSALDCLYYYTKFTPGEGKIIVNHSKSQNSYLKIRFKSDDIWEITNSSTLDSVNTDSIGINKLN